MITQNAKADLDLMAGGSYSQSRDVIKHVVYDTWHLPAASTDHTYFSQPVGSQFGGGTKTLNETNLTDSGKLPNGQVFLVKRFGVKCISYHPIADTDAPDVAQSFFNVLQSSVFELRTAGRDFDMQLPGSHLTPMVAVNSLTATDIGAARAGDTIASGWYALGAFPIVYDQLVNFSAVQRIQNAVAAAATVVDAALTLLNGLEAGIQVQLEGVLSRAK